MLEAERSLPLFDDGFYDYTRGRAGVVLPEGTRMGSPRHGHSKKVVAAFSGVGARRHVDREGRASAEGLPQDCDLGTDLLVVRVEGRKCQDDPSTARRARRGRAAHAMQVHDIGEERAPLGDVTLQSRGGGHLEHEDGRWRRHDLRGMLIAAAEREHHGDRKPA
jgi:hypothetical protein